MYPRQSLYKLASSGKLLQYLAVTSGGFVGSTKTLTKSSANFSTYFAVGDKVIIAGTSNNNGTFTITVVTANAVTFSEALVNETSNCTIHGIYVGAWIDVRGLARLIGTVNMDQAGINYIDQSCDKSNVDYTTTTSVVASTPMAFDVDVIAQWARIRTRLNTTTALTVHRSILNGKVGS